MGLSLGIEIGKFYLKLVGAQLQGRQTQWVDCAVEPILSFTEEQIIQTIGSLLKQLKWKPEAVSLCLPRNMVTARNLHLPSHDRQEVTQMIDLQMGSLVPYRKEETAYVHHFIGKDKRGYTQEFVAIVHGDTLRKQVKMVETVGLPLERITLSSYGSWRWVLRHQRSQINASDVHLLLDIDSAYTDFILFSRDHLLFTHGIAIGAKGLTDPPSVTKLLEEAQQSLVIFQKTELDTPPKSLFLCGAVTGAEFHKTVEAAFSLPVQWVPSSFSGKPLVSLSAVSELVCDDRDEKVSFTLPEMQIRKSLKERAKELTLLGSLVIYLFVATLAFLGARIHCYQSYLSHLSQKVSQIEKEVGDLIVQSKQLETAKEILNSRRLPFSVLYELQKKAPREVALQWIEIDRSHRITLRGESVQLSDVFRFVTILDESELFKEVQTKYTRTKQVRDKEVTDFELNFYPS